ncbi:zinc finger domain-containing protein [Streptomyces chartreusis]
MTPAETAELLGLCAAFDRRTTGRADVAAWATVLADLDFAAAKQAVTAHYAAETRWIMPADIRQAVLKQRADTAADYQGPGLTAEIPDADPDDVPAYLAAIRSQRTRAADGLKPRPLAALLAGAVRQLTAGNSPALEEDLSAVRRPGPLGIACPTCRAAIGRPCKTPDLEGRKQRERPPHAARKRTTTNDERHSA